MTEPQNKELKLTKPGQNGASQLNSSVRRAHVVSPTSTALAPRTIDRPLSHTEFSYPLRERHDQRQ